jgi:hypothetical protein
MFTNSPFLRNATSVGIVPFTSSKEVKEVALNVRGNEVCYFSRLLWKPGKTRHSTNKKQGKFKNRF